MVRSRLISLSLVMILVAGALPIPTYAAKATPLVATFGPLSPLPFSNYDPSYPSSLNGVFGDVGGDYVDGDQLVSCYFGVNNGDVVLVTYNSTRTLHFVFDDSSEGWQASGLPQDFSTQVDLFGINYYGRFYGSARRTMGVPSIARIELNIQFYQIVNGEKLAFQLEYPNAAAIRYANDSWLITTDPTLASSDFTPSPDAELTLIRRRNPINYGIVSMPIQFRVRLK